MNHINQDPSRRHVTNGGEYDDDDPRVVGEVAGIPIVVDRRVPPDTIAVVGDTVPCGICGRQTAMTGTKRCDRCWELERRIAADLPLAQTIVALMTQEAVPNGSEMDLWETGNKIRAINRFRERTGTTDLVLVKGIFEKEEMKGR